MPFSKLLQHDTESVTPSRAAATFMAEVNRLVREQGMSLDTAWAQVSQTEPDLYARISYKTPTDDGSTAIGNDASQRSTILHNDASTPLNNYLTANKPFVAVAFGLTPNVDSTVLQTAFAANKNQTAQVNFKEIFLALCTYYAKTMKLTVDAARSQLCKDFPQLCRMAGQMPGTAALDAGNDQNPFSPSKK